MSLAVATLKDVERQVAQLETKVKHLEEETHRKDIREFYLNNLHLFWKDVWCSQKKPNLVNDGAHKEWCDIVQSILEKNIQDPNDMTDIMMLEPRASMKTSFWQAVSIWWRFKTYYHYKLTNCNIFYVRKDATKANDWISELRDNVETNEKLHEVFGSPSYIKGTMWSTKALRFGFTGHNSKDHEFMSFGLESTNTGSRAENGIVIWDDCSDEEDVISDATYDSMLRKFQNISPIVYTSTHVVIGTRWGERELFGHILKKINPEAAKTGGRKYHVIQGTPLKESYKKEVNELRDLPEDPTLYRFKTCSKKFLIDNRKMGLRKWLANFFQAIIQDITKVFKSYHCYTQLPPERHMKKYLGIDIGTGKQRGDYTAIVILGYDTVQMKKYVLDVYCKRSTLLTMCKDLAVLLKKHNVKLGYIEKNSMPDESVQNDFFFNNLAREVKTSKSQLWSKLWLVHNSKDKNMRIEAMEYDINYGFLLFPEFEKDPNNDDLQEMKEELEGFSSFGGIENDDALDALELANRACNEDNNLK